MSVSLLLTCKNSTELFFVLLRTYMKILLMTAVILVLFLMLTVFLAFQYWIWCWLIVDQWLRGRTYACDNLFKAFYILFRKPLTWALFILNFLFGDTHHFCNYLFNRFSTRLNFLRGSPVSILFATSSSGLGGACHLPSIQ